MGPADRCKRAQGNFVTPANGGLDHRSVSFNRHFARLQIQFTDSGAIDRSVLRDRASLKG
jgi:hypothetical protein